MPALAGNGAVQAKGPEDVIRVILGGHLATGTFAPMPPVGAAMTDQEIADVTDYVRTAWSNAAPVIQKTGLVANIRAKTVSGLSGPGAREDNNDPCLIGPNSTPVPSIDDPQIDKTIADIKPELDATDNPVADRPGEAGFSGQTASRHHQRLDARLLPHRSPDA